MHACLLALLLTLTLHRWATTWVLGLHFYSVRIELLPTSRYSSGSDDEKDQDRHRHRETTGPPATSLHLQRLLLDIGLDAPFDEVLPLLRSVEDRACVVILT